MVNGSTPKILISVCIAVILTFSWANELLDLPHILLSAPATPVNWEESVIETVFILIVGFVFYRLVAGYEKRLEKHLEGLHTVCSYCHAVKDGETWIPLATWLMDQSEAVLSHGLCPKCLDEKHPELRLQTIRRQLVREGIEPSE